MSFSFGAGVRDSLSNLAASLGTGRDKASHDVLTVFELGRGQIEAMYRGDWLARKVVDIVPYDSVRAWRSWSGHRADVARFEAAERRLGLPRVDPRAAQRLDDALSDDDTRRYDIGNQVFQFDKAGMRYTLERHAPEYWNGYSKQTHTFFPRGTSMEQIQQAAGDVSSQNREMITAKPSEYQWRLLGTSDGVRYNVTTYLGRITHVVPLP